MGDYNLTLESFDLEYNITETAYARIEELTGLTNSAAEYKDVMVTKLRSQYGEMMELRSVASELGMPLALYSPSMETVDMLRSRRMMGDREREDTTLAPELEELEDECKTVTADNVQECWEATVNRYFQRVDKDYINSFLATADLSLISYSPSMMVALAQGVQMLSLGVFIMTAPTLSMIYGDSAAEHPVSRLPCLYDIIMEVIPVLVLFLVLFLYLLLVLFLVLSLVLFLVLVLVLLHIFFLLVLIPPPTISPSCACRLTSSLTATP